MAGMLKIPAIFSIFLVWCIISFNNCESKTYTQGEILYQNFCVNCHMEDGTGLEGVIPPLADADWIKNNQDIFPCIIRTGMEGAVIVNGKIYNQPMTGIKRLSPFEIANIINYVNSAWGNDYGYAKFEEVKATLEGCPYEYN